MGLILISIIVFTLGGVPQWEVKQTGPLRGMYLKFYIIII